MKKLILILGLFLTLNSYSQMIINEPCSYKGLTVTGIFINFDVMCNGTLEFDSVCNIIGFDTLVIYYAHQYASIGAYCTNVRGTTNIECIQTPELIDHYSVYKSLFPTIGFYQYYKNLLLIKNPTWDADNIIILQ